MDGTGTELARLRGVHKRYGAVVALDGIDLSLGAGQVHALLGANGAGKTTAIALLLGLASPDAGEAALFGQSPHALAARRGIGIMLQSAALQETLQVRELIDLTRSYYADPRGIDECVALAGLEGLETRRYGRLSGGQQRRVQFALALCGRPRLLFLDEPTTGLDLQARQGVWRAVRALAAEGAGVLLTTHYIEEAEALADRVTVLVRGRVVASGAMEDVRARVSRRHIRCATAVDAAVVAGWPQVDGASRDGAALEIVTPAAEAVVRRLLAADPALHDLEVRRAGLSDAFLELTREDARPAEEPLEETT